MTLPETHCRTCKSKACSILRDCSEDSLRFFDTKKNNIVFRPGEWIIREGSLLSGVYIIQEGVVKVHIRGRLDQEFILRLGRAGEVFGYAADKDYFQSFSVTAVEPTVVCFIESADFEAGVRNCPSVYHQLQMVYKNEIKTIAKRAVELAQMRVRERVADALLQIMGVYHLEEGKKPKRIALSRQDISDMTGTTKEQVSKIISEFKDDRLIEVHRKYLGVLNYAGLLQIATVRQNDNYYG